MPMETIFIAVGIQLDVGKPQFGANIIVRFGSMVGVDDVEKTAALLVPESPAETCNTSRLKTLDFV